MRRPYERSRRLANDVLREYGADEPSKIDPLAIIGRRGIRVKYGKLEGATARIFMLDGRAVIRISDAIVQEGRLRFSLAHEVGHYLLGHQIPSETELAPYSAHQEREADVFAAEHNTPEAWVRPHCDVSTITLEPVREIARTFRSSIVASAIRFVELSASPCAVVYSERGRVVWAKRSRGFSARIPVEMKVGTATVAHDFHARDMLDPRVRVVRARAWLGSTAVVDSEATLLEHAVPIPEPGWGGVLSLLSLPQT